MKRMAKLFVLAALSAAFALPSASFAKPSHDAPKMEEKRPPEKKEEKREERNEHKKEERQEPRREDRPEPKKEERREAHAPSRDKKQERPKDREPDHSFAPDHASASASENAPSRERAPRRSSGAVFVISSAKYRSYSLTPERIKLCKTGRSAKLRKSLKMGYFTVGAQDEYGNTALMHAVQGKKMELVDVLLEFGADAESRNYDGTSVRMFAQGSPNPEIAARFLTPEVVNDVNGNGVTTLMVASALPAATENIRNLLSMGAEVGARDSDGNTALMHLVLSEEAVPENIAVLVGSGADVCTVTNNEGMTALSLAARHSTPKVLGELIKHVPAPSGMEADSPIRETLKDACDAAAGRTKLAGSECLKALDSLYRSYLAAQ